MHINCKRTLCKYWRNHRDSWKQFGWHLTSFHKFHNRLIFCWYQMLADQLPIIWVRSASSNIKQDAATYRAAWCSYARISVHSLMRLVLHLHVIHTNHLPPWCSSLLRGYQSLRYSTNSPNLCNSKVYYYFHNRASPVPVLSRWTQSMTSHNTPLRAIPISSHLHPCLQSHVFSSSLPIKSLHAFLFFPLCVTYPTYLSSSFWSPKKHLVGTK